LHEQSAKAIALNSSHPKPWKRMAALKCQNVTTRESIYKTSENVYARKLKLTPDGGFLHDTGAFRGKPVKILLTSARQIMEKL
jgi:hypothetical protein